MKLIAFIISFFIITELHASCFYTGITSVCKRTSISSNSVIILEFYGSSQKMIPGLNKSHPIVLRNGNSEVVLSVVEVLHGDFMVTQVIFKPASRLESGKTYELEIKNMPRDEMHPRRYNAEKRTNEPISFLVTNSDSVPLPSFTLSPMEVSKSYIPYGCGPAKSVNFSLDCTNESTIFARTTVTNLETGAKTTYIVLIENGVVSVGHNMCSGGFLFSNPRDGYGKETPSKHSVIFSFMDGDNNLSQPSPPVEFTAPVYDLKKFQ